MVNQSSMLSYCVMSNHLDNIITNIVVNLNPSCTKFPMFYDIPYGVIIIHWDNNHDCIKPLPESMVN